MGIANYSELYGLQDQVAALVCSIEGDFYLTGGTCLNRYYHEARYSDDLDFFYMDSDMFRAWIRDIRELLTKTGFEHEVTIDSRDFVRIAVKKILKVDLVNDRVYRIGQTVRHPAGLKLDNVINILANKLTAIIGRDEPKDVFDFQTIVSTEVFDWSEVMDGANKKCAFSKDELVARLESFPLQLFDRLNVLPSCNLVSVKSGLTRAITALIKGSTNVPWKLM